MVHMGKKPGKILIPLHSAEALWEWHVSSDALWLSKGAAQALHLSADNLPLTMTNFLAHIPPDCLPTLHELREGVLSGAAGSLLESSYPFDACLVRERMIVLERNPQGRAVAVMGYYDISDDTMTSYQPPQTTDPNMRWQTSTGYWRCCLRKKRVWMDARCTALLGYADSNPLSLSLGEWKARLHPEESHPGICRYQLILEKPLMGDVIEDFLRVRTENGEYTRVLLRGAVLERNAEGHAVNISGSLQSMGVLDHSRCGSQENGRLLFAINATGDGLWDWDSQTDTVYYSPRYLAMLGYTAEQFPGTLDVWKAKIHPDDYHKIIPPQRDIVESPKYGDTFECTYRLMGADNKWVWILGRGYVTHRDSSGRATRVVGMHTNITTVQNDREKLENLVKNDALTGLRSRSYCDLTLARIERDHVRPVSIICCDMNGLKLVNDHLGHAMGDALLSKAALLLREPLRATDCIARMGGDEFVVLLTGCPESKGCEILQQIEKHVAAHNADENDLPVYISFGLASTNSADMPLSKVFMEADRKMLAHKAACRKESHRLLKNWIEKHAHVAVSLEDNRYDS